MVINATSDNGDFHPALTPIILAAQKNNCEVVKVSTHSILKVDVVIVG